MYFIGLTRHCYSSYTLTNSSNTRCNILFFLKKEKIMTENIASDCCLIRGIILRVLVLTLLIYRGVSLS